MSFSSKIEAVLIAFGQLTLVWEEQDSGVSAFDLVAESPLSASALH